MGFWEICALTWEPFSNSFLDRSFTFAPSFLPNRKVLLWVGTEAVRRSVNGSSAFKIAVPLGVNPAKISALASATASMVLNDSIWAGAIRVIIAVLGLTNFERAQISPL